MKYYIGIGVLLLIGLGLLVFIISLLIPKPKCSLNCENTCSVNCKTCDKVTDKCTSCQNPLYNYPDCTTCKNPNPLYDPDCKCINITTPTENFILYIDGYNQTNIYIYIKKK